ncbi:type II toxin-antitoxin system HicA family toxin [Clostridium rectalis]|uniref:type II toxin-antitoxin system HicA family toxin n=1 Tax=Clostridium rectalis TaxID=2040295 RepID=UPI000F63DD2A|nr:type II toxin-antitoxin system HicA family toxin [Clostridium rectalis]
MPKWRELKRFCDKDGWELYKSTDHYYYRKKSNKGKILKTKVSRGTGEIKYHMWKEILRKQLQVSEEYFNSVI